MNNTACRYYTERSLGWMLNNKLIVFLSLLSFCLFVSTLAMAGQRNRLHNELEDLKNSLATTEATNTEQAATETTEAPTSETETTEAPTVAPTEAPTEAPTTEATTTTTTQVPEVSEEPIGPNAAKSLADEEANDHLANTRLWKLLNYTA